MNYFDLKPEAEFEFVLVIVMCVFGYLGYWLGNRY